MCLVAQHYVHLLVGSSENIYKPLYYVSMVSKTQRSAVMLEGSMERQIASTEAHKYLEGRGGGE